MREVDRIAVDEFGLGILQMMENAGRNLALNAIEMLGGGRGRWRCWPDRAAMAAGDSAARGICTIAALRSGARPKRPMRGAARAQLDILHAAGCSDRPVGAEEAIRRAQVVSRRADRLQFARCATGPRRRADRGRQPPQPAHALAGRALGPRRDQRASARLVVHPERTLTLALPKTGLRTCPARSIWPTLASRRRSMTAWACRTGRRSWMRATG